MLYDNPTKYIYPPRPETCFPRKGMDIFDNGTFIGQPKFNGSCCEVYIGGENYDDKTSKVSYHWKVMNRHKQPLTNCKLSSEEFRSILDNKGMNLFVGEYMNKSKKDENNQTFNHKLVLFDILVYNNEYLIGKTFRERLNILYNIVKPVEENLYSYKITDNIYITKSFDENFSNIWDKLVSIDMIEGMVLKRSNAGLELGLREVNNTKSQLKCRKATKLYNH